MEFLLYLEDIKFLKNGLNIMLLVRGGVVLLNDMGFFSKIYLFIIVYKIVCVVNIGYFLFVDLFIVVIIEIYNYVDFERNYYVWFCSFYYFKVKMVNVVFV